MRKQKKETTTDYIAIILIGGGSSWGRNPDKEKAIQYALQAYKRDWGQVFVIKKDDAIKLNVIDAYPYNEVSWDHSGFHADGAKRDFKVEHFERTVP